MPQDKKGVSAQPAQVEDYDSDESRVVPETVVQASHTGRPARSHHANLNLKPTDRSSHRRDAASDSGYSSHASAPLVSNSSKSPAPAPAAAPAQTSSSRQPQSPVKNKPILHRADSARSTQRAQTVSSSTAKCPFGDPNCRDPDCHSKRNTERRHTFYQPPTTQQPASQQYPTSQYPSTPQYQYAPVNPAQMSAAQAMPPPARPRSGSISRPRPLSMHAGYAYDSNRSGPPPSASAYYSYYPQQAQQYLGTTPPTQVVTYPPQSPVPQSPTSPTATTYPGFPGYTGNFSARQMNPNIPGLEALKPATPGLTRTVSARRPSDRPTSAMPGKFPDPESTESESDTTSESEYSESDEEDHRHRRRRESYQDPRLQERRIAVAAHSRRPSVGKKYYTETAVPTNKSRRESRPQEPLRRAPRSDTGLEYHSSSDINDSDRTQRAVVDRGYRRSTLSSAHSSRRPSVSTTASSGRTKATSLSSATDYSRVVVETANGRQIRYLSKDEQSDLIRRLQQQKLDDKFEQQRMREEKVAAYQRNMAGGEPYELTAENVKAQNRKSGSHSNSHVSRGKSSVHSGSKAGRSDGIKIKSGDTVLHVYGDAKIEMRASEDGGAPQLVIASSSGRDSGYQGSSNSKSSGSRMGRSRVSRRDKPIREEELCDEGGYERQC